mmetsp:Transcript_57570/g.137018  ORF Transcript_57570/g.137018 Transcript_57570/m.137018 type:complete len:233 (+) Transcript_57570:306-1004(+)
MLSMRSALASSPSAFARSSLRAESFSSYTLKSACVGWPSRARRSWVEWWTECTRSVSCSCRTPTSCSWLLRRDCTASSCARSALSVRFEVFTCPSSSALLSVRTLGIGATTTPWRAACARRAVVITSCCSRALPPSALGARETPSAAASDACFAAARRIARTRACTCDSSRESRGPACSSPCSPAICFSSRAISARSIFASIRASFALSPASFTSLADPPCRSVCLRRSEEM